MLWILVLVSVVHTVFGTGCDTPLGVGTEKVKVDCSTPLNATDKCKFAGLNTQKAWCSDKVSFYQFLQVTLPSKHRITKISIRGDPESKSYTSFFSVVYPNPLDPKKTVYINDNSKTRTPKRFKANTDPTSVVSVDINLSTKVLFIIPYKWQPKSRTCLSFELYGCDDSATVDHCAKNNGGCEQLCTNSASGPVCSCKPGYTQNKQACKDIDECASPSSKCNAATSVCKNSPGSYTCQCKVGYKEDTSTGQCLDIDECTVDPSVCKSTNKKCVNAPGSYKCTCIAGYTDGPNGTCVDIDECASPSSKCDAATSVCKNSPGSYTCDCKAGYKGDTGRCLDIDECARNPPACTSPNRKCVNVPGSYKCTCMTGYTDGPNGTCVDIDECVTKCTEATSVCKNSPGSYTCECKLGFKKDTSTGQCQDIDECAGAPAACTSPNKKCENVPGSYKCNCITGFTDGPEGTCVDIDECASPTSKCNEATTVCKNSPGSYTCECKLGFKRNNNTGECVDIDECTNKPSVCTAADRKCVNVPGSYKCTCLKGYTDGPNGTCVDIDECTKNPDICDKAVSSCHNTEGSYKCVCKPGYQADINGVCQDIDECKDPSACRSVPNSSCVNGIGSFECKCTKGYEKSKEGQCVDVDECLQNPCDTSVSKCMNTIGSYQCPCLTGFHEEKGKCVDTDECKGSKDPCTSRPNSFCVNTFGSYLCNCKKGFEKDASKNCIDKDECLKQPSLCDQTRSTCVNLPGTYECKCNKGYRKDASGICQDIDECAINPGVCDNTTSTCTNSQGGYYCTCKAGYVKDASGNCKPVTCKKFSAPANGHLSPSKCNTDNVDYKTRCNIECNPGYKLTSSSTTYATCRADREWDFEPGKYTPVCEAVQGRCSRVAQVANAVILHMDCTTKGAAFGQTCKVFCNGGFDLAGQSTIKCLSTGRYDGSFASTECIPRPKITCLDDFFTLSLPFGQKTMTLLYTNYKTNVPKSSVTSTPRGILDRTGTFAIGTHEIKLTAKSKAGVQAHCTFVLRIVDREGPTVKQCNATNQYFNVIGTRGLVSWTEPIFTDNVGIKRVDFNLQNNQQLAATVYYVQYTALDTSGNSAVCKFFVHVRAQTCQPDKLPGGVGCFRFNAGGDAKSYRIFVSKTPDKAYYDQTIIAPFVSYYCQLDTGVWQSLGKPVHRVTDCVSFVPKQANQDCPANHELSVDKLKCLQCPQGRHFDATTQKCKPCPMGSYQDLTGQSTCKQCPLGTGTTFEGATSSKSCSDTCLPGFFSTDGFNRAGTGSCRKCPIGSYQPRPGQASCELCPLSASTDQEGSKIIDECVLATRIFKEVPRSRLIEAKEGDTISFSCYAYGIPLPRMSIKHGKDFPPAAVRGPQKTTLLNSASPYIIGIKLEITKATLADSVTYDCVAENNFGKIYNSDKSTFIVDVML